jgi:hypothetical protein
VDAGGNVTARGQDVRRVNVNGKRYYSDDQAKADVSSWEKDPGGIFTAAAAEDNTDYLRRLKAASAAGRYGLYLQLREAHLHMPLFYFRASAVFFKAGQ